MQLPKRQTASTWATDLTIYTSGRVCIESDTGVHRIADGVRPFYLLPIVWVGPDLWSVLGDPGSNGQIIQSDNTQASGLAWVNPTAGSGLTPTAVKTSAYTAVVGDLVPADATTAGFTVTLPSAPAAGSRITVKKIDTSVNAVTVAAGGSDVFNKSGGATTLSLLTTNQAFALQYSGGIWYALDSLSLAALDTRFAPISVPISNISATGTPSSTTYLRGDGTWATPAGGGTGITRSIVSITTSTTLGSTALTDYVALIGASGAPILPTAVGNTNLYTVKNIDTTNKTLATTSSQTIDGSTTAVLTPNTSLDVISDNANWWVI